MNKIEIIQKKISKDHNDSVWYEGHIAQAFSNKGKQFVLIACGDIRINDKEGIVFDGNKERNNGIKGGFNSDKDLKKIGNNYDDKYFWENNNWFEVMYKDKDDDNYEFDIGVVVYDYDEGIELLKSYVEEENNQEVKRDIRPNK